MKNRTNLLRLILSLTGSPLLLVLSSVLAWPCHAADTTGVNPFTGAGPENPYVQRLLLNRETSTKLWLPIDTLLNNKMTLLTFDLGNSSNTAWAAVEVDSPPSFDGPGCQIN